MEKLEAIINKETLKVAGKLFIPLYNGVVAYNELLGDSYAPKYLRAIASGMYAAATLGWEISIVNSFIS